MWLSAARELAQPISPSLWLLVWIRTPEFVKPHDRETPQFWETDVHLGRYGLRMKDQPRIFRRRGDTGLSSWKQPEGETYSFGEYTIGLPAVLHLLVTVNDTYISISRCRSGSLRAVRAAFLETRMRESPPDASQATFRPVYQDRFTAM